MKFVSLYIALVAFCLCCYSAVAAPDVARRQGSFSIGSLDPSLSSMLQAGLSSAASYTSAHTTIPFSKVTGSSTSSACPQGGQLANGYCCPSGQVINGQCYAGSTSTSAPATTSTAASTGSSNDGVSVLPRLSALFACLLAIAASICMYAY